MSTTKDEKMIHEMEIEEVTPAVSTNKNIKICNDRSQSLVSYANKLFSEAGDAFRASRFALADSLIDASLMARKQAAQWAD